MLKEVFIPSGSHTFQEGKKAKKRTRLRVSAKKNWIVISSKYPRTGVFFVGEEFFHMEV